MQRGSGDSHPAGTETSSHHSTRQTGNSWDIPIALQAPDCCGETGNHSAVILRAWLKQPWNGSATAAGPCHTGSRRGGSLGLPGTAAVLKSAESFLQGSLHGTFRKWSLGGRVNICKITGSSRTPYPQELARHTSEPKTQTSCQPCSFLRHPDQHGKECQVNDGFGSLFNANQPTVGYSISFISNFYNYSVQTSSQPHGPLENLKYN